MKGHSTVDQLSRAEQRVLYEAIRSKGRLRALQMFVHIVGGIENAKAAVRELDPRPEVKRDSRAA